jgi:hypothetical protein
LTSVLLLLLLPRNTLPLANVTGPTVAEPRTSTLPDNKFKVACGRLPSVKLSELSSTVNVPE